MVKNEYKCIQDTNFVVVNEVSAYTVASHDHIFINRNSDICNSHLNTTSNFNILIFKLGLLKSLKFQLASLKARGHHSRNSLGR